MIITHLGLTNFRNYASLELELPPHITVLQGDNAQGKSNLLEAIYVLATSRSPRTYSDRELINWEAFKEEIPACRITAKVQKVKASLTLEIALSAKAATPQEVESLFTSRQAALKGQPIQKRVKINGVLRHSADLIGQLNVVTFSVYDIDLVSGYVGGKTNLLTKSTDIINTGI